MRQVSRPSYIENIQCLFQKENRRLSGESVDMFQDTESLLGQGG